MAKNENMASVLAFEKKLVPSDGFMFGANWKKWKEYSELKAQFDIEENETKKAKLKEKLAELNFNWQPLKLREKSVRGTISNRLKPAVKNDPLKLNAEVEKPNLQRVDSCALATEQDTLKLQFTLKVLSGVETPSACNNNAFNETYHKAAKRYIASEGFAELAGRYASNIANGRFLWRNRVGAEKIEVQVTVLNGLDDHKKTWGFDASQFKLRDFEQSTPELVELSNAIADSLSGKTDFLLLEINAFALIGKAQDVYPSEELVLDKSNAKDKKSKILYDIDGIAGMHSQKIGNALRTVDTWYPDFEDANIGPIALEPYGAVTNLGTAFRNPKAKSDFFTLFDKFATEEALDKIEDQHYVMGVLVRGGVFGESGKE